MCCSASETSKASLLKRFGNRKTLVLWKEVEHTGMAEMSRYHYRPGEHIAKGPDGKPWTGEYSVWAPCGIHVYRRKPATMSWSVAIPVIVRKEDLVCADRGQAVFRKIRILKKDWVKAGLPLKKVRA